MQGALATAQGRQSSDETLGVHLPGRPHRNPVRGRHSHAHSTPGTRVEEGWEAAHGRRAHAQARLSPSRCWVLLLFFNCG